MAIDPMTKFFVAILKFSIVAQIFQAMLKKSGHQFLVANHLVARLGDSKILVTNCGDWKLVTKFCPGSPNVFLKIAWKFLVIWSIVSIDSMIEENLLMPKFFGCCLNLFRVMLEKFGR